MTERVNDTTTEENLNSVELAPLLHSEEEGESYPPTYARFTDALMINCAIQPLESIQSIELTEAGEEGSKETFMKVDCWLGPSVDSLLLPLPSSCLGGEANTIMAPFLYRREQAEP